VVLKVTPRGRILAWSNWGFYRVSRVFTSSPTAPTMIRLSAHRLGR
jgi:hypothetical protein